jgi:trans-aconitate methyltransferase
MIATAEVRGMDGTNFVVDDLEHWLQAGKATNRGPAPGGALAVQMPNNLTEPAHWLMRELASAGRTTHHHPLPGGVGAVDEWLKGSGLRAFPRPFIVAVRQ